VRILAAVLLGAAGALAAMALVPTPEQQVGPAKISIRASLGQGDTVVRIPPFGTVSARTHHAPLRLTVTLTEVNPRRIARLVVEQSDPQSRRGVVAGMMAGLRAAALHVGERLVLGGLVVGGLVAALLPGRHIRGMAIGGAAGLAAVALLLLMTARQYDIGAFQDPSYTGTLERAPELLAAVQKHEMSLAELRSKYEVAAERLAEIVTLAAAPDPDPRAGSVAILHVSDIHSNPLGVELALQLADRFQADAVLDTGDLTSFGQPIEARIGQLLAGGHRPWLFVPGNHDSPEVRAVLGSVPNVVVLDQRARTVGDVSILGWGDPTFTPGSLMTNEEARRRQVQEAPAVAARVEAESPDVLAVHNVDLATMATGHVPLVLSGHGHRRAERTVRGTLELQVGSTGATGLGSFLVQSDLPYEAEMLYFRDRRAVAVDYIRFRTLGGDFEIQRQTLGEQEPSVQKSPAVPAP
jgi:predicted MPP superfamily phosphohydrolase